MPSAEMTDLERAREFVVGYRPNAICDDCIADKLDLSPSQRANHKTKELAVLPRFVRGRDGCFICRQIKDVVRFA